ncbi:MAG: hypothetical protein ACRENJ_02365 [Candidatus Eiseniibacteriota bacterium]
MFLGHLAVGLAGKRVVPRASLATWFFAPLFLDLLWPIFLLLGWEQVRVDPGNTRFTPLDFQNYPWSHSLHMTLFWAGLVGIVFRMVTRDSRGATWIGMAVASHWVMDWITHRPDLPIWPGGPKVGLGLWNSVAVAVAVEVVLFIAGLWLYLRATRPRGGRGRLSLWSLVVTVTLVYLANLSPLQEGTSPRTVALMALFMWIVIPWAWWIDATRRTVR